jgi:RimJ/RimL family protein N-acetyltransferase
MEIKNQKLTLRSAIEQDAIQLTKWWNDGQVMAHAGFPKGLNVKVYDIKKKINKMNCNVMKEQLFMILYDDINIGEMHYRIDEQGANIGIKICDFTFHNKGLGTEALRILISFLFEKIKVKRIYLDTNVRNINAQKTYEKLGFNKIGLSSDVFIDQLGIPQSCYDYELIKK